MKSYYEDSGVRETCHAVKQIADMESHKRAVIRMAEYLSVQVDDNAVLIPAPQHVGHADYTLEIAGEVSKRTGAMVLDILKCIPHTSLYDQKKSGQNPDLILYIIGPIPRNNQIYFVDNVLATGYTFQKAREVIGNQLKPLIYAEDKSVKKYKQKRTCS